MTPDRQAIADEGKRIGFAHLAYVFGEAGPSVFDCSGLIVWCWKEKAGLVLPHNSGSILTAPQVEAVPPSPAAWAAMQLGDTVGYYGRTPGSCTHIALYVGEFAGMHLVAQAGDPQLGTEVIRAGKYGPPAFLGYVSP